MTGIALIRDRKNEHIIVLPISDYIKAEYAMLRGYNKGHDFNDIVEDVRKATSYAKKYNGDFSTILLESLIYKNRFLKRNNSHIELTDAGREELKSLEGRLRRK